MAKKKKHWINNHVSQAEIIGWLGLILFYASKTGDARYLFAMFSSMIVGAIIVTNTPK